MSDPTKNDLPFLPQIISECGLHGLPESDARYLYDYWLGNGFKTGRNKVKDWRAVIRVWKAGKYFPSQKAPKASELMTNEILDTLAENPSYKKVDVRAAAWEFKKWCLQNKKPLLVTSFLKYLNAKL